MKRSVKRERERDPHRAEFTPLFSPSVSLADTQGAVFQFGENFPPRWSVRQTDTKGTRCFGLYSD